MPKKIAPAKKVNVGKSAASQPIKKEAKSNGKKKGIDEAVENGKSAVHYILILDDSYSMEGKPWKDLQAATNEYLKALVSSREAATSKVSCVIYNSDSRIVFENEKPTYGLINKVKFEGGATYYGPALKHAKQICDKYAKECDKFVFYFMSDGCPHDFPTAEVNQLKK